MDTITLLAVDIGGTNVRLCATTRGTLHPIRVLPTATLRVENALDALANLIVDYLNDYDQLVVDGIIIAIPGTLADDLSQAIVVPNVPELNEASLVEHLAARFGCKVYLERDANIILMGEWDHGAATRSKTVLGAFMGTGFGAGFLVNGHPMRGHSGGAMELGHITIRQSGLRCVCGKLDCLEAHASGRILATQAQEASIPIADLFSIGWQRPDLHPILSQYVEDNATVIAMAIQVLDPEVVILGGGVPSMQGFPRQLLVDTIMKHLKRPAPHDFVGIKWTQLNETAFVYGAIATWKLRQSMNMAFLF